MRVVRVQVPLVAAIEHARAKRAATDNILVEVQLSDGTVGWGEGVPRSYVTGETAEGTYEVLGRLDPARLGREVPSWDEAVAFTEDAIAQITDTRGVVHNAARSALELALLDGFSRAFARPLLPLLARRAGHVAPPASPQLRYSLVAGRSHLEDPHRLEALRDRYGYRAVKMKVGFGLATDLEHAARVRTIFGPSVEIRVDANRAWSLEEAKDFFAGAASLGIRIVEDPLAGETLAAQVDGLRRLRQELGVEVVLDESLRTLDDLALAHRAGALDVVNIRVSKCGGLLRSLALARAAHEAGIGIQLGCQVGETAILSAAGRRFAQAVGSLRFLEGSNEHQKYRTGDELCSEDLNYGEDAIGSPLGGLGLGVTVLPERVRRFALASVSLSILPLRPPDVVV